MMIPGARAGDGAGAGECGERNGTHLNGVSGTVLRGGGGTRLRGAGVDIQAAGVLAIGDEEGVHGAGGLQAGDGGAEVEGFAGTEGNEVFSAVHDAGDEDAVAEAEVFEVGGEAQMHHLGGGDKKGVRGLCKGDSGA